MKLSVRRTIGFTLAEILITLGVIGVIASLTIPTLIENYQKNQTVTQLKKTYSTLSNAIKRAEIDNGSHSGWILYDGSDTLRSGYNFVNNYILPYVNYSQRCSRYPQYGSRTINCFQKSDYQPYKMPNGDSVSSNSVTCFASGEGDNCQWVLLQDGSLLGIQSRMGIIQFAVDLNGAAKGPNTYGKDVFDNMFLSQKQELSAGENLPTTNRNFLKTRCTSSSAYYCAQLIVFDGWQIKDDYPWN